MSKSGLKYVLEGPGLLYTILSDCYTPGYNHASLFLKNPEAFEVKQAFHRILWACNDSVYSIAGIIRVKNMAKVDLIIPRVLNNWN